MKPSNRYRRPIKSPSTCDGHSAGCILGTVGKLAVFRVFPSGQGHQVYANFPGAIGLDDLETLRSLLDEYIKIHS